VNIRTAFKTNSEFFELMKPRQRSFNNPTSDTESASMLCAPLCQHWDNVSRTDNLSMRFRIISAVALDSIRTRPGSARFSSHRWDCIKKRNQLSDIMRVGASQNCGKGNTLGISYQMVFTPLFPTIRGIGTSFFPPCMHRTEALSTIAREKSIWSASRSLAKRTSWMRFQTPTLCHLWSRRQQVMPEPHPISGGNDSHGMPVLRTNKMPVRTCRLSNGKRPGKRFRRRFGFGSSGSMIFHKSSFNIGLAMGSPF